MIQSIQKEYSSSTVYSPGVKQDIPQWQNSLKAAHNSVPKASNQDHSYQSSLTLLIDQGLRPPAQGTTPFFDYSSKIDESPDDFIGKHILYSVPVGTPAAVVPSYWNSENTSDRIFNYAMMARNSFPELSDLEFSEKIEKTLLNAFANAKDQLGFEPDDELAQLYNDTFTSTMERVKNSR